HEMPGIIESQVRDGGEDPREGLAHALLPFVTRAAYVGARGTLENAFVTHEGHQDIDVVTIPTVIKECFQILDRHHRILANSNQDCWSAPIAVPVNDAADDLAAAVPSQFPIHLVPQVGTPCIASVLSCGLYIR